MARAVQRTRGGALIGAIAIVVALVAPAVPAGAAVAPPSAPTGAAVVQVGPDVGDVWLQWTPGVGGGAVNTWKYDVSADGGAYSAQKPLQSVWGSGTTKYGLASCAAIVTCAFHVYAGNASGSAGSNVATGGWRVPGAPTITAVDPGPDAPDMLVTWTLPADTGGQTLSSMSYMVRSLSGGAFTGPFAMTPKPNAKKADLPCPDPSAAGGCEYKLLVSNATGTSVASAGVAHTFDLPTLPNNFKVVAVANGAKLTWAKPDDDGGLAIWAYQYRSRMDGGVWVESATLPAAPLNKTVPCTGTFACEYQLRAWNGKGASPWTATAALSGGIPPGVVTAPSVTMTANSLGSGTASLRVSWSPPNAGGATNYDVQQCSGYCIATSAAWNTAPITSLDVTTSFAPTCGAFVTCSYRIRATNPAGAGPWTTVWYEPFSVTNVNVTRGPALGQVRITFNGPAESGPAGPTPPTYEAFVCFSSCTNDTSWTSALTAAYPPLDGSPHLLGSYNCGEGVPCSIKVRFNGRNGSSSTVDASASVASTGASLPNVPSNLIATTGDTPHVTGEVDLSWTAPTETGGFPITDYEYRRSTDGALDTETWTSLGSTATTYTDLSCGPSVTCRYEVRAVTVLGASGESNEAFADGSNTPSAPVNLVAVTGTAFGATNLTWQMPTSNGGQPITDYEYRRSTDGNLDTESWISTGSTNLSFIDTGCGAGVACTYEVRAVNVIDPGPASNQASAAGANGASAPTLSALTSSTQIGYVDLGWTTPLDDGGQPITSYEYRFDRGSGFSAWTNVGNVLALSHLCNTPTGNTDTTCTYEVRAITSVGAGASSNQASATGFTDHVAPTVSLAVGPSNPMQTTTPSFSGTCGTDAGDLAPITVNVYAGATTGGTLVQTRSATCTSGSYSVVATALGEGRFTARASQTDWGPNTGFSAPVTFVIDTTAPTVSLNGISSALYSSSTTIYSNESATLPTSVSGTASDPAGAATASDRSGLSTGSPTGVQVTLRRVATGEYWDGSAWVGAAASASVSLSESSPGSRTYTWSFGLPALPGGGSYEVSAKATDVAGNAGSPTSTTTFSVDFDPAKTVFVDGTSGTSGNDGFSPTSAKQTINQALAVATSTRNLVVVRGGSYGAVSVNSATATPVTVRGGYSASFLRAAATSPYPGATNTVSIVGSGTGVAIGDSVANQNVKLQQLAIDSGTPVGSGASAYGIRAVSSTVAVTNSSVVAQSGNDGSNGVSPTSPATPGGAGGDGPTGGAGTTPIAGAAGTGANPGGPGGRGGAQGVDYGNGTGHGGTGAQGNGPGGTGGVGGVNGSFNGLGGKKGLTGTAGTNGASGAGGALSGSAFGATFTPASGVAGTAGSAGSGGGGGGGGGDGCESGICSGASNSGGSGGGGGGGGAGGGAGSGGVSGGGSFAIWSYNSTVTVDTSSTIQSKNGGNGGNGGNGQAGAAGGAGGKGGNGACSTCTGGVVVGVGGAGGNPGNGVDGTDATGGFFTAGSGGGGGGGSGAGGGSGGGGGGGAGGATAGTVSVGTGGVTVPNAAGQITIGVAGTPGTGGGGPGIASGQIAGIDTLAPTLSSMSMKDTNGNGKVDQVLVNFNEPLASYSAGTAPWTLANIPSGGTLSSVSVAGSTATLTLAEGAGAPNTAVGSFTVALAANAFGIRDAFGNQSSFAATAPADAAAPVLSTLQLQDSNGNGKVDRIVGTFSEALATSSDASVWTLGGVIPSGGTKGAVSTSGTTATLLITEGGGAADTSVGSLTVALAAGAGGIRDATGNQASFTTQAPADAAVPVRTSLVMQDVNGNGKVDRVVATFSEPLASSTDNTVWTLANVPSAGTKGAVSTSGTTATLLITEGAGAANTAVGSFTVALAAGATGITDAAGNQSSFSAVAPTDGAAPALVSLVMQDSNTNGKVDRIVATYSETLVSSTDNTLWTLGGTIPSGGTKGALTTAAAVATLAINEGGGAPDTSVGTLTVALAASASGIKDGAGNLAPAFAATAPADGATPVRTGLVMQDANGNGKVDQVVATFSEPLASSTDNTVWTLANVPSAGTKGAVSTSGATATLLITEGAGAANTAVGTFTVALAAGATGIRDAAGNQSSFSAVAPTDGAAPALVSLVMQDANTNGKVDRVVATYSEALATSTDNTLWTLSGAIPSGGTKGAVSTSGSAATLLITEGAGAVDTSVGTLTVALANGASGIKDAVGNLAPAFGATPPSDGAAPIRTSLVMQDANANGKVDRIVATYSESLASSTDNTLWTLGGAIPSGGTKGALSTSGATATLLITEGGGAADTSVGTLTVAIAAGATSIRDAAGNQAAASGATAPTDGAAPVLLSLVLQDANANGIVDRIVATYSETLVSSTDNTLWTLGGTIPSGGTKGALSTSGPVATLLITEGAGAPDTSVGSLTVALTAGGTGMRDAAGNQAAAFAATAPADGAAPVRLSMVMQDTNGNGKVDRVVATFSETLASSSDNTVWTLANTPSAGTKGALSTAGATATLLITEGAGAADTGVGSFTVALAAGAAGIRDAAGNLSSFAAAAPSDGATPVLVSLFLRDNDANGKVDRIVATYSESLASSTDNTLWTLGGAIPSGGTKGALSTAGATATVLITEGAGAPDTSVGTLTVAIASGATSIRDAAGNQAAALATTAPTDGALPVRLSLVMQDANTNGKVDRIVATYSESLASSTDATLWTLGGAIPSGGAKGALSTSGAVATLLITEGAGAVDTGVGTLTVALANGATGIRDAAGNQAATFGATAPTDGAIPLRTALSMQDANTNGKVDRVVATYSEALATSTDDTLWTLGGAIPSGGTKGTVSTSGNAATLLISEGAGAADTSVGTLTVALAAGATGIRDAAGNQAAAFAATAPADGAAPVRLSMVMQDTNGNGKVDRLVMTFSESLVSTTENTTWTLANTPSAGTKGALSTSVATVTLLITEGAGSADTSVGSFTVALATSATGIRDAAGNLSSFAAAAPTDGAAPVRTALDLRDNDTNGKVDRIVATYSESLAVSTDATLWTLGGAIPSGGAKGTVSTSTNTATLLIAEGAGAADTAVGTLTVALTAGATGIRDAAGLQAAGFAATAPTDDASPVTVSVVIANNNGTVASGDSITVVYSEPVATLCTAWGANSLTANQSTTNLTGNFNNLTPDTFTVTNCAGFGTINLPGNNWVTSSRTITTTATWTFATRTLVLSFTAAPSGTVSNQSGTKTYAPGSLSDGAANTLVGTPPTISGGF